MRKRKAIEFGDLPRSGYVYGLYRGHVLRLGLVTAVLLAILFWGWSGSWVTVRSCIFPNSEADYTALAESRLQKATTENPNSIALSEKRINNIGVFVQNGCYRLQVAPQAIESLDLSYQAGQLFLVQAGGEWFLAAADSPEQFEKPLTAVFTPISEQLNYDIQSLQIPYGLCSWLMDCRKLPVGYESSDTVQMILLTIVGLTLLAVWVYIAAKLEHHPIYRQLGRYGIQVSAVVDAIDREVAAGAIVSESRKQLVTTTWNLHRSAFMTGIFKNTSFDASSEQIEKIEGDNSL